MLIEVTLKVPKEMGEIISQTSQTLYVEAIKEVMRGRLNSTQKRLDELNLKISQYEEKYHQSYQHFSQHVPDTIEGHDDWNDWTYLDKVAQQLIQKIEKYHFLLGK